MESWRGLVLWKNYLFRIHSSLLHSTVCRQHGAVCVLWHGSLRATRTQRSLVCQQKRKHLQRTVFWAWARCAVQLVAARAALWAVIVRLTHSKSACLLSAWMRIASRQKQSRHIQQLLIRRRSAGMLSRVWHTWKGCCEQSSLYHSSLCSARHALNSVASTSLQIRVVLVRSLQASWLYSALRTWVSNS